MGTQHARRFSRRRFLGGLTVAGMGGFLGLTPRRVAAEPPPETTRLRVLQAPPGLSFWGRFFENGHDTHVFTLTPVPVAPAA